MEKDKYYMYMGRVRLPYLVMSLGMAYPIFKGNFLIYHETGFCALGVLGVPEVDLVLDALGAGTVLEFFERQEHGEGLAIGVG